MQTILVKTIGNHCIIRFESITAIGFCGKNGTTHCKQEGDGKTPMGIFPIRYGFYREKQPETAMPMVRLSPFHHFVDAPASPCYNRLVFGNPKHHSETMWDYPHEYNLGLVIEYNRPITQKNAGSAIFFHCGHTPTAGCIATSQEVVSIIIRRLDPDKDPHIRIM